MQKFNNLYTFVEFAKNNRKYPESTANNLKSALKIFEKVLTDDEFDSIDLIEQRIEEIFLSVIKANKDKNIASLNTYKARLLRVISDYKKYGQNPAKMQSWQAKSLPAGRQAKKSTRVLNKKDRQDKTLSFLSNPIHSPVDNVHKIELSLRPGTTALLFIPHDLATAEAKILKSVIDSLTK